jgi:NAD+ diphosphatase
VPQSPHLAFAHNPLDRAANHRSDETWVAEKFKHSGSRHIRLNDDKTFVTNGQIVSFAPADDCESIFLGLDEDGVAWFASATNEEAGLTGLRALAMAGTVTTEHLGILAQARSLLHWHGHHGYCANCGVKTVAQDAGYRRHCAACGTDHFPRTDPVIIIAVQHRSRTLLGRQTVWPTGMYSTLAGFMEPGETIEDAARREVFEESGIRVGDITFHSNQPWPFPSSLMIGLTGVALNDDIVVDTNELETARWFEKPEVETMLNHTHPDGLTAPLPMAIAHHLIRATLQLS